eukprot:TRINITY_DN12815_c0_g1_i1.p1 TRINITY_DN12815_c0_g1~~TRINITY_DN12815_c0_g1_i1.p1  ORF type:complete len:531 (-),score=199.54 TRINITY_DN12815_c0_g1_i1:106-1698(-)
MAEMQKQETKRGELRNTYELQDLDLTQQRQEGQALRELLEQRERTVTTLQAGLTSAQQTRAALEAEMKSEMRSQLTQGEQRELNELNEESRNIREELIKVTESRSRSEGAQNEIKEQINANLNKRRNEFNIELTTINTKEGQMELDRVQGELSSVEGNLEAVTKKMKQLNEAVDTQSKHVEDLKNDIENAKQEEHQQSTRMTDESKNMEKLMNKRSVLIQKREDCTKRIRELGTLPSEAVEKYRRSTARELMTALHEVNVGLREYAHVNKKALDQYVSFTDQREVLIKRKQDLDEGTDAIDELIRVLDAKKDEAIRRTFKGVAKNFAEVFKELVPEGHGKITILRSGDSRRSEVEEGDEEEVEGKGKGKAKAKPKARDISDVMTYVGVSVEVSFDESPQTHFMQQLSGGQKSLVALALIFAIQRADPAPFYLFDEIDSALDPNYRKAVADMIKAQSKHAQFIMTTFKPELVEVSKKWYGISHRNDTSSINPITKAEALQQVDKQGESSTSRKRGFEDSEDTDTTTTTASE